MTKRLILAGLSLFVSTFFILPLLAFHSVNAGSSKAQTLPSATPTLVATPTLSNDDQLDIIASNILRNDSRIEILELEVRNLESGIRVQSEAYSATVSRMEANLNLLLAFMTIASIVIAILGFGFVKFWVRQLVEERVKNTLSQEIKELAKMEMENIRKEWDPKFASLYDEYRKSIPRK